MRRALILGAGFTGGRVATLLESRGWQVTLTSRSGSVGTRVDVDNAESLCQLVSLIDSGSTVLHSVPARGLMPVLRAHRPARVVYLSTTGVYGAATEVNLDTPVDPRTERERLRVLEEMDVLHGPWSGIVLRPAAIYGPGRGIHASMRAGHYRLMGDGSNFVSRIHVDDLAGITAAVFESGLTGAFPVADDQPCTSLEIATFCARLLQISLPASAAPEELPATRRSDRRVDGSGIRRRLGFKLQYPSYREGIPACLAIEARALSTS